MVSERIKNMEEDINNILEKVKERPEDEHLRLVLGVAHRLIHKTTKNALDTLDAIEMLKSEHLRAMM